MFVGDREEAVCLWKGGREGVFVGRGEGVFVGRGRGGGGSGGEVIHFSRAHTSRRDLRRGRRQNFPDYNKF